ncbi:MAG: aldehyde dehydrogenase family protein [Deltaproteobacteria bacterium]|nr:aldehyde dehydrogenase family protein [Deltaproteobacteria bacterium]
MLYVDGQFSETRSPDSSDVEHAISAATRAFREYSHWPAWRRAELLAKACAGLRARREELERLIVTEARKPIQYARAEVDRALTTFTFAEGEARRMAGEVVPLDAVPGSDGRLGVSLRVPRGPVAAITPFNFPLNLSAHKIAPALACGATLVHKPAPETPGVAMALARIIHDAGAPPGVLNVVSCTNEDAAPLVEDERLRVLSFTGSSAVGWALTARAGSKKVLLELGGNAAVILEPDADLPRAIPRLVAGAFAYAGQVCISVQRVYVADALYETFRARFVEATLRLAIVGDPWRADVMVGPLIRTRDADRVEQWIAEAVAGGARLCTGAKREGDFVWPTVLEGVPEGARLCREEVFGPVVMLERSRDLDDAIARVNDSPYGLQAGIYTHDTRKVMKAFHELQVGAVIHNDVPVYRADHMPYGGTKRSGIGREGVRYAIEEMTEPRLLVMG